MKAEQKPKVETEHETRKSIIKTALRFYGPEAARQVQMHFDKYDKILKNCKNETEYKHIAQIAIVELHKMMQFQDGLNVNGVDVLPSYRPKQPQDEKK